MAKRILSRIDIGGWAEHYASGPRGHYRKEVYGLFIDILSCLPGDARILDVGAGPGNLTREFFRRRPKSPARWVLLDSSRELLGIARERLASRPKQVRVLQREFNARGWDRGTGKFDATVSNNALFCVRPRRLKQFYAACFGRLKSSGVLLNQQSFAFEGGRNPYGDDQFSRGLRGLPDSILPKLPGLTAAGARRLERRKRAAVKRHEKAVAEARAAGVSLPAEDMGYQWLTVERHLGALRAAGFAAGCIWRKREFAVLMALKGNPFSGR